MFYKELATIYNDWREGRLDELVMIIMMEEMQINIALKYKLGCFFEAHHAWHIMPGKLTTPPRMSDNVATIQTARPQYSLVAWCNGRSCVLLS